MTQTPRLLDRGFPAGFPTRERTVFSALLTLSMLSRLEFGDKAGWETCAARIMIPLLVGTTILVLFYGLAWHDQSARERDGRWVKPAHQPAGITRSQVQSPPDNL